MGLVVLELQSLKDIPERRLQTMHEIIAENYT